MTHVPNSYSSVSFVFASDTTPAQAMRIHAAVAKFSPSATLRASPQQDWLYGPVFGIQYTDLDSGEPVQAALKKITYDRDARITSLAQTSKAKHFIEPLGFVLIALGAIGVGVANKIGEDLWTGVKSGVMWWWRRLRQNNEPPSVLARPFDDLGHLHDHDTGWNPVVFLQIPQVRLTFVVEPQLPKEAIWQAEWLILYPTRKNVNVPLRWHRDRKRWVPVTNAILSEEALRELREDIHRLGREK